MKSLLYCYVRDGCGLFLDVFDLSSFFRVTLLEIFPQTIKALTEETDKALRMAHLHRGRVCPNRRNVAME